MGPSTDAVSPAESRLLFRVALAIFTVTVLIGMFNGFHFIQLSRAVLLTHVHAGTLGFITLTAFGAAFWLYGVDKLGEPGVRMVAMAMAIAVPLYVLGFLSGNFVIRAVTGTPVLVVIVMLVVLLLRGGPEGGWSVPSLGMLLAFMTLIIGSTLGVLIQIELAISHAFLPDGAIGGHAAAQVAGYLVLFTLSLVDWRLNGTAPLKVAGAIQVVLLFVSGVLLAAGVLLSIQPLLGAYIPLEIIAIVIFFVRVGRRIVGVNFMEAGSARHYAIAVPWIIFNLGITMYVISIAISKGINAVPNNVFIALDHTIFIGVMVNAGFALMADATADRPRIMAYTENVVFWVMNLALLGFVITLLANQQWAEKFFVPFQGIAILVGIVAYSMRLMAEPAAGSTRATPAMAGGD